MAAFAAPPRDAGGRRFAGWLALGLFTALWSLELFAFQHLAAGDGVVTRHPLLYAGARLALNVCLLGAFACLLPRGILALGQIAAAVFYLGVFLYASHFAVPPSWFVLSGQSREGMLSAPHLLAEIPPWLILLLGGSLAVKGFLLAGAGSVPPRARRRAGSLALAAYVGALAGLNQTSFRLSTVTTAFGRIVYGYGLSVAWLAQHRYTPPVSARLEQALSHPPPESRALVELCPPMPVTGPLIVVQMESVDYNVVDWAVEGRPVTPFLNRLKSESLFLKLLAFHEAGTVDMEFALLFALHGMPGASACAHRIPPVPHSLPRRLRECGYASAALHGNAGDFFHRRESFAKAGFDRQLFREDLEGPDSAVSYWGLRDAEILGVSRRLLREGPKRQFQFIITLDSHAPFDVLDPRERTLIPQAATTAEKFCNSMHHLDGLLRSYVESLPPDALVVLYGDHAACRGEKGFESAADGPREYVPCWIYDRGGRTRGLADIGRPAGRADFTLLDVRGYLLECVRAGCQAEPSAAGNPSP